LPGQMSGGWYLPDRVIYVIFLLMLLFAARRLTRKQALVCCLAAILPFAYLQQRGFYKMSQLIVPYGFQLQEAALHIAPRSTILYLVYGKAENFFDGLHENPLRHMDGYLALLTEVVLVNNYEGLVDHFPVRFRSEVRSPVLEELEGEFTPGKFAALQSLVAQSPNLVNYVVTWEADHGSVEEREKTRVRKFLSSNFRLIYESSQPAPLYVYAR
jgi:hypothetical protein